MGLKAGIVGLPNVGKSTLFNAITKSNAEAANYPFATINPNNGMVIVQDERLDYLTNVFKPKKKVNTSIEIYDIAGLVKGASKGEGLGNQFLSHIRETDAILHLVRCFDSNEVIHVENTVDPKRDVEIINLELAMADLESVTKRIDRVANKARVAKEKDAIYEMSLLTKLQDVLQKGLPARMVQFSEEDKYFIRVNYNLLTTKPVIYVANVSELDYANLDNCAYYQILKNLAESEGAEVIAISCQIESEIAQLDETDQKEFFETLGITESGINKVVKATYDLLNLNTFFTVGADECRAWTFKKGMTAPQCAGIIHTDFQRGFIRAEVYSYDDFVQYKSELALKEAGKLRIEGKDYIAKDGDVFFFRFNV